MPRQSRNKTQISEEEKKARRRQQKKLSIRRVRAKMTEEALEERRAKDRERYKKKKELGLNKTINDYTPREQRQIRKIWRVKAIKKRQKDKVKKIALKLMNENTPPSTPSTSRVDSGRIVANRNRQRLKLENQFLREKLEQLERKLAKYRMRLVRVSKKHPKKKPDRQNKQEPSKKSKEIRASIHDFLSEDENSRLTSGKKETITRQKQKKQIRWLNDSILNLHKKYLNKTGTGVSYETFRRYRPFWILVPRVNNRNTCLCTTHTNMILIIQALQKSKIVPFKSASEMLKSMCCNEALQIPCLERQCEECRDKGFEFSEFEPKDTVTYERWITKNVEVVIKGKSKLCKKTVKESVCTTKKLLLNVFQSALTPFMKHVANYIHQLRAVQKIKQQLTPTEGLLHIDFSENYNCKYGEEVQSAHFGGSKPQLSLHTSVYYSTDSDPPMNVLKPTSMCTISENLRHDPVLICTHLKPIITRIKELSPELKHLHILSDGPTTQYRNKSMFHLIATFLAQNLEADTINWHYSEKGHGKGAPDGVGGCIKRVCDNLVARGNDVSDYNKLMSCAKQNCKGIEIYDIADSNISVLEDMLQHSATKAFKGTLKIHQLSWSIRKPETIQARRLSCLICAAHINCPHYGIGQIDIQFKIDSPLLASLPDHSRRSASPDAHAELLALNTPLSSPVAPATPDATVPNSPSLSLTPYESTSAAAYLLNRPKKRTRLSYDDNSMEMHTKKLSTALVLDDEEDDYAIFD